MAAVDLLAERKRLPGARHGHIEEPALVIGRITPSSAVKNQDMIELESFGTMGGQQHQRAIRAKCTATAGTEFVQRLDQIRHNPLAARSNRFALQDELRECRLCRMIDQIMNVALESAAEPARKRSGLEDHAVTPDLSSVASKQGKQRIPFARRVQIGDMVVPHQAKRNSPMPA